MSKRLNVVDYIGKKYNKLTVIKEAPLDGVTRTTALCKCDCGEFTIVVLSRVKEGGIRSCQSCSSRYLNVKTYLNKTIGIFKILKELAPTDNGGKKVLCECIKCGSRFERRLTDLKNKKIRKCSGCIVPEYRVEDYIGKTIGNITIIKDITTSKDRTAYVLCECSCNRRGPYRARLYRIASREVTHCRSCPKKATRIYEDYKNISGVYFRRVEHQSTKRNLEFNLTIEYLNTLLEKQNFLCVLSGLPIRFYNTSNRSDNTASLDRIDSNKGYIVGNVQWLHKDINQLKHTFSQEQVIEFSRLIARKTDEELNTKIEKRVVS